MLGTSESVEKLWSVSVAAHMFSGWLQDVGTTCPLGWYNWSRVCFGGHTSTQSCRHVKLVLWPIAQWPLNFRGICSIKFYKYQIFSFRPCSLSNGKSDIMTAMSILWRSESHLILNMICGSFYYRICLYYVTHTIGNESIFQMMANGAMDQRGLSKPIRLDLEGNLHQCLWGRSGKAFVGYTYIFCVELKGELVFSLLVRFLFFPWGRILWHACEVTVYLVGVGFFPTRWLPGT